MDYRCFVCNEFFVNCNATILHLKDVHNIKDGKQIPIRCIVNRLKECQNTFKTIDGLRKHVSKCADSLIIEKANVKIEIKSITYYFLLKKTFFLQNVVEIFQQKELNKDIDSIGEENSSDIVEKELSIVFEHQMSLSDPVEKKTEDYSVHISCNKSETQLAAGDASKFLSEFCQSVIAMNLTEKNTASIFKLSEQLVSNFANLNRRMLDDDNGMSPAHVITSTTSFFLDELSKCDSTYKRNNTIKSSDFFVEPKECSIGTRWEKVKVDKNGKKISVPQIVQNTYQYISIVDTCVSILKSEKVAKLYFTENTVLDHKCEDGKYKHFCCGSTYKNSQFFHENPLALQISLSSDDFEICSPLQSKANVHKICAVYFTIRNMPTRYLSKVNNIYLVAVCNSDDLKSKTTDFNNIWQRIVFDLDYLERVGINVNGFCLKGTLTHLAFDNLGANLSLGFVPCFSASHYCRHCLTSRNECQTLCKEQQSKIRTRNHYDEQIKIIDVSEKVKYDETKGVKYYCKLNDLQHFHITTNPTVDIMHDLLEGCVPFLMKKLFLYGFEKQVFKEKELNLLIQFHDYGQLNRCKVPSMINLQKRSIGQNATQNQCLFTHLPFVLYEFRENPNIKKIWVCVTSLLRIMEIVFSYEITKTLLAHLNREIKTHLESLQNLLNEHLRPKHHFLLHYGSVVQRMGPLIHMSMMRYEATHQKLKRLVSENQNFRNINKTLAYKHQRAMANIGHAYTDDIEMTVPRSVCSEFISQCRTLFDQNGLSADSIRETSRLVVNQHVYSADMLFIYDLCVYQIQKVLLKTPTNEVFLCGKKFEIVGLDKFLNALQIRPKEPTIQILVNLDLLSNKKTFDIQCVDDDQFIISATIDLCKENLWK